MADNDNINIDNDLQGATEWDDILIKHGIKEAPTKQLTEDEITSALAEAKQQYIANQNKYDNKTIDELNDLSDYDDDDDRKQINYIRQQRIQQLKQQQINNKYGDIIHISEDQYKQEVTESSKNNNIVIVCLIEYSNPNSQLFLKHLTTVARKYRTIKFIRIEAQKAIPSFPQSQCPTLLIYKNTNIIQQYVGLNEFGGQNKINDNTVEQALGKAGYLGQQFHDEHNDNSIFKSTKMNNNSKGKAMSALSSDEDDDIDSDSDD